MKNVINAGKNKKLNRLYSKGTRIKLIAMKDDCPVPSGTRGTVDFIDIEGQIHMKWDNGSSLALIYGYYEFEKIKNKERERYL